MECQNLRETHMNRIKQCRRQQETSARRSLGEGPRAAAIMVRIGGEQETKLSSERVGNSVVCRGWSLVAGRRESLGSGSAAVEVDICCGAMLTTERPAVKYWITIEELQRRRERQRRQRRWRRDGCGPRVYKKWRCYSFLLLFRLCAETDNSE